MRAPQLSAPLFAIFALLSLPAHAADRTVVDDTGRTVDIPENPQHIVVMHEPLLGLPLVDLGVQLTGSYGRTDDGDFVIAVDFIDTVFGEGLPKPRGIGPFGQPDLEKLNALEPDLILATELDAGKAGQLATAAPVYMQKVTTGRVQGFDIEEDLARLLGLEKTFEMRKSGYLERLAAFKSSVPDTEADKTFLGVFITDQLNVVGSSSGMVQVLHDLGYQPLQIDEKQAAGAGLGSILSMPLSAEQFGKLNPDMLILLNSYASEARDEAGTRAALDKIVPGWSRFMKPALEGRVLFLDPAKVISPTVASAEHMLDALEIWAAHDGTPVAPAN
ncbi:ABC transporter substrate-binding protein [Roseibium sp. RKSG952]|uniref:ABC transporter substrate-binding protein n=1 Tax=Roseibium sp. RKSG952 TaxID=2529384 RepID=UPI0012BCB698|nr:ABC transporter substrate-binding protein [Roseibium sp. RKSG952]MTH98339.1 ABC transporter substrate-binding protein [Roseibium sp. RKSG952]